MIQFNGTDGKGGRLVGIGLSAENMSRLLNNDPILIDLRLSHGLEGSLLVVGGATEDDIERDLRVAINFLG